jgi:diguanylate cyclase (GGDEF)-like protein/PAS domain S-box-containing protein
VHETEWEGVARDGFGGSDGVCAGARGAAFCRFPSTGPFFPQGAIIVFDHDLRYLCAGGRGLSEVGLSQAMLEGNTVSEVFPPDVAAVIEPLYRLALAGEESATYVPFEGREFLQRLAPLFDADGVIVAGMGFTQDMTAARQVERALHESEARFRLAFEHAPIGKALIGLDGRYEQVNPAICSIAGLGESEMLQRTVADITHREDFAADAAATMQLISGELTTSLLEQRFVTETGAAVWVSKSASLVRSEDGSPMHFIVQVQDISERKSHDKILADERRRLREAQSIGRLGSWELDIATNNISWSDTLFELYGLDPADFGGDYTDALLCIHPDDRSKVNTATEACLMTGEPIRIRYRVTRPDGELRWFDARGEALYEHGEMVRLTGAVADVTDHVAAETEALAAHAFQQAVVSASPDIIFVYDLSSQSTVWTNRSLTQLLGYGDDLGADVIELVLAADGEHGSNESQAAGEEDIAYITRQLQHADGSSRSFSCRITPLSRDASGSVTQVVGALRDVTAAMVIEQRLHHAALHDELTGLPNRGLLVDRLDSALTRAARERREVAVLFCDLDGFKRVNDSGGHAAGDAVLVETARRLEAVLRTGDTVARVGGDEFVIVVEPWDRQETSNASHGQPDAGQDRSLALGVAQRVSDVLREPIRFNGVEHVVSASIGITYADLSPAGNAGPVTADKVLQDADAAMYRAKGRGKDRFEVFEYGMHIEVAERGRVEQILRSTLRCHQNSSIPTQTPVPEEEASRLTAAYQPVFDSQTGILVGFEALARLTDTDGTSIPPDVFIGVAEDTALIRPLGRVMLELACNQLRSWRAQTPDLENVTMAVNVSALQAQHPTLLNEVHDALTAYQLAPTDLVLELTETALLQAAHSTLTNLRALHDEGVGIAIDDFGTGYASLRYLATLPVSTIKIDRSFTAGLPHDETSRKIVSAVAGLAADMQLTCVVEGVETQDQRDALPDGVHVQGWLTGRPQHPSMLNISELALHGYVECPAG